MTAHFEFRKHIIQEVGTFWNS